MTPDHFAEQLRRIRSRFRLARLEDVVQQNQPADTAVVVTFDDGYADTLLIAKPLLEHFEVPATVFLPTGHIGSTRELWWDALERLLLSPGSLPPSLEITIDGERRRWEFKQTLQYSAGAAHQYRHWRAWEAPPTERHVAYRELWEILGPMSHETRQSILDRLFEDVDVRTTARDTHRLLRQSEVCELVAGDLVQVGSHSVTHPILATELPAQQRHEIVASKAWLEGVVRRPVTTFAYPYGQKTHYSAETATLVREAGYVCACANSPGVLTPQTDLFGVPRLQMHDYEGAEFDRVLDQWAG